MARIIINDTEYDINDDSNISDVCIQAGVSFNCNTGVCGSCVIKVLEGADNLSELSEEEIDLGMDKNNRLACMCTIKSGVVKLGF